MASKWLTDTGAKQLSLPYRLGVYAIPEEKQSDVSSSTRVKSNWCIIYEDGDVMNYRDDNIRLVPLAEYCAWCDKYHRRRILNSRHKDDIRELCSKFQTNGINHFTYSTVAKRLNMSYKLVWTIVTGNQYY